MDIEINKLYNGDCLEVMPHIKDGSIDLILCDLPYGISSCKWDKVIDISKLWEQYNRVIKDTGAIVLTATLKFAVELINGNKKHFRHDLVWHKSMAVGFANSHRSPLRAHELILVFGKTKSVVYNPQGLIPLENSKAIRKPYNGKKTIYEDGIMNRPYTQKFTGYPRSVINFSNGNRNNAHPVQKPQKLFEYLIKTYSNEQDIVLDNCIGSGTTALACIAANRRFIGIEKDKDSYELANERIKKALYDNTDETTTK